MDLGRRLLVLILLGALACGADDSFPDGHADYDFGLPVCVDAPPEALPFGTPSALGVSAERVLEFSEGEHAIAVAWSVDGSSDELAGTLTLSRTGDEARFVDRQVDFVEDLGDVCRGRIEVDVDVDLALEGAAASFAPGFAAVLVADSAQAAWVTATLNPDLLRGDARVEAERHGSIESLEFWAAISPQGSSGAIGGTALRALNPPPPPPAEDGAPPQIQMTHAPEEFTVAAWPNGGDCEDRELGLERDAKVFDVAATEVLDALPRQAQLTWLDGEETIAHFDAVMPAGGACLRAGCLLGGYACLDIASIEDSEHLATLGIPVAVSIATDDGRWNGTFDANLEYRARKDGGLAQVRLTHAKDFSTPAELAAHLGLRDVPTTDSNHIAVRLDLDYPLDGSNLTGPVGAMTIRQPGPEVCGPDTYMCLGIPSDEELDRAEFTAQP